MGKLDLFRDTWRFLRMRRKWWLAPLIFLFVILGFLLVFAQTSVLAPFIYTLI